MTAKDGKYSCGHQNFLIGQVRRRRSIRDKGQPDHVSPHPLGLRLCFGPDLAVDVEAGVTLGKRTFRPFRAQKLLADKVGQDLAGDQIRTISKARLGQGMGSLSEDEASALRRLITEMYGE